MDRDHCEERVILESVQVDAQVITPEVCDSLASERAEEMAIDLTPDARGTKTPLADRLSATHREVARLHIMGLTITQIAKQLDMSQAAVRTIVQNDIFKAHIAQLQGRMDTQLLENRRKLYDLVPQAISTLGELVEHGEDRVRLGAAKAVLDYSGFTPPTLNLSVIQQAGSGAATAANGALFSAEEIEALKQRHQLNRQKEIPHDFL